MTREEAIEKIEATYAPDSLSPDVRAVGQAIMNRAREDRSDYDWRNEPEGVLIRAAELCDQIDDGLGVGS